MRHPIHKLSNIADVFIIQLFRDSSPQKDTEGNAYAISIRDLTGEWPPNVEELTKINISIEDLKYTIKNGDILMPARGDRYPARLFGFSHEKFITVGQINVIRASAVINEVYLAWYLNRKSVQKNIIDMLSGTAIKSLNKSKLQSIEVSLPGVEVQENIELIQSTHEKIISLKKELLQVENAEVDVVCENFLKYEA